MLGELKPGEKPFKDEGSIDGIFLCDVCACHYSAMCQTHPDKCKKVSWFPSLKKANS